MGQGRRGSAANALRQRWRKYYARVEGMPPLLGTQRSAQGARGPKQKLRRVRLQPTVAAFAPVFVAPVLQGGVFEEYFKLLIVRPSTHGGMWARVSGRAP